jgi:hypothetical protein
MGLAFIHGVNVRKDADYESNELARNAFFQDFVFKALHADPTTSAPSNPYWGDLAASFAWNHASLPEGSFESFGAHDALPPEIAEQLPASGDANTFLLTLARQSILAAVDLLSTAGSFALKSKDEALQLSALVRRLSDYAEGNKSPKQLATFKDDKELILALQADLAGTPAASSAAAEATTWEHFGGDGVWTRIAEGMSRIKSSIGSLTSRALLSFTRSALNDNVSRFLGDVFVYLNLRGDKARPGPIVQRLLTALRQARLESTQRNERFVVVAHSMGGIVTYDILTHFAPDLKVDVFATVGSQVALFEELKLFRSSSPDYSKAKGNLVELPKNIAAWINVFDHNDVLSYSVAKVFEGTYEFAYDTGVSILGAHSAYFTRPSFYRRMAARLEEILK